MTSSTYRPSSAFQNMLTAIKSSKSDRNVGVNKEGTVVFGFKITLINTSENFNALVQEKIGNIPTFRS